MAQAIATIVGTLGGDPELRFTNNGVAVCSFSVAVGERVKNGDQWEDDFTTWYRATAWRGLAENIAESFTKGQQVILYGKIANRPWQDKDGQDRLSLDINVEEAGPSLRFATASVSRNEQGQGGRQGGGNRGNQGGNRGGQQRGGNRGNAGGDPWGSAPDGY